MMINIKLISNKCFLVLSLLLGLPKVVKSEELNTDNQAFLDHATVQSSHMKWRKTIMEMDVDKIHLLYPIPNQIENIQEYNSDSADKSLGNSTYTVSTSGLCDFTEIQAAIDNALSGDVIQISAETYSADLAIINIVNKWVTIIGGYSTDCKTLTDQKTILDGTNMTVADTVVEIRNSTNTATVSLSNLIIKNGVDDLNDGGGIEISGDINNQLKVLLSEVSVIDNGSDNGGGIHVTDAELRLTENTIVSGNAAVLNGGGVYCSNGEIYLMTGSYIGATLSEMGNTATNGGGVFLDNCGMFFGGDEAIPTAAYVLDNTATQDGGGLYAQDNSLIVLRGEMAWINLNKATRGGGFFMASSSDFSSDFGIIKGNQASFQGGGFFLSGSGTDIDFERANTPCNGKCLELSQNEAQIGGAGYLGMGASAVILGTWIEGNTATDNGMAFSSLGDLVIFNSMIVDHQSNGLANELIHLSNGSSLISHSTIAGNQVTNGTNATLIKLDGDVNTMLDLENSIIWGNDVLFTNLFTTNLEQAVTLSNNIMSFNLGGSNLVSDPLFFNNISNFHIRADSPAIDYANNTNTDDIDGQDRHFGVSSDAGADEAYALIGIAGQDCQYTTISEAITAANDGDTIYMTPGTYIENLVDVDKSLTFVPSTGLCHEEDMDANSQSIVVDGGNVFRVSGGVVSITNNANVTFRHMTLKNGYAAFGGNIFTEMGTNLILDDTDVTTGQAREYGGGINTHGNATLKNGSGIYGNIAAFPLPTSRGGSAQSGGGIAVFETGILTLEDDSFIGGVGVGNLAVVDGGGVYCIGGSIILGNSASIFANSAQRGGGVYSREAIISLNDNSHIGKDIANGSNTAVLGGGLFVENTSIIMINSSHIINNQATTGGGIYIRGSTGDTNINNGNIDKNTASDTGGGVYIENNIADFTATLTELVIENNQADHGAGISVNSKSFGGHISIKESIIQANIANTAGGGLEIFGSTGLLSFEFLNSMLLNNVAGTNGGGLSLGNDSAFNSTGFVTIDGNQADQNGGGIYIENNGAINLKGGSLSSNIATNGSGGGIYAGINSNGIVITSQDGFDMDIGSNKALNGNGGAIYQLNESLGFGRELEVPYSLSFNNNRAINGGAIYIDNVSLFGVGEINFIQNSASANGGAIYANHYSGSLTGVNNERMIFNENKAEDGHGGALYLKNNNALFGIVNADFGMELMGNEASENGGAVYLLNNNNSLFFINTRFNYNIAQAFGGGIYADGGSVFIDSFMQNSGFPITARGVFLRFNACDPNNQAVDQYCSQFNGNIANTSGAAIATDVSTQIDIKQTAIQNHAKTAIRISRDNTMVIENSLIARNAGVAAMWLVDENTSLSMVNSTITDNTASQSILISSATGTTADINNTIVWGNSFGNDFNGAVSGNCNLTQDGSLAGLSVDPLFETTQNGQYRLASNSPAIDDCVEIVAYDLEDIARSVNGDNNPSLFETDIGAFEYSFIDRDRIFINGFE